MPISITLVQSLAKGIMAELGAGYSEAIYRNALARELQSRDPQTVMEHNVPIMFRGHFLGTCRADIVTTEYVIEIKALKSMLLPGVGHQIKKYLKHLGELEPMSGRVGLVVNFNQQTEAIDFMLFQPSLPSTGPFRLTSSI